MTEKRGGTDLRETRTAARFSHSADYQGSAAAIPCFPDSGDRELAQSALLLAEAATKN
jgi:hypothetical protein